MITRYKKLQIALVITTLAGLSGIAHADRADGIRYSNELEACVTAVKASIDLDGVHRIRHIVIRSDVSGLGYALTLETSTFTEVAEKQYSANCVASGNNRPSTLKIEAKTG